jgi:hypothetical protein
MAGKYFRLVVRAGLISLWNSQRVNRTCCLEARNSVFKHKDRRESHGCKEPGRRRAVYFRRHPREPA